MSSLFAVGVSHVLALAVIVARVNTAVERGGFGVCGCTHISCRCCIRDGAMNYFSVKVECSRKRGQDEVLSS
ncbi:hypothetical protein O3P69_002314 [Scylla paramamosain]|uniref:Secreted protein n=1 Tax=Scylla paramamosain TaxID=85552 RepID=A0AAW0V5R5_SCYPA